MHKSQAILDAVIQQVTTLKTSGVVSEILQHTAEKPKAHPCLVVRMGDEEVVSRSTSSMRDNELSVYIDIVIHSKTTDLDKQILVIREQVEKVILADYSQGLPFVLDTQFRGQESPDYSGDAELYAGSVRLSFAIKYRTPLNNPSV